MINSLNDWIEAKGNVCLDFPVEYDWGSGALVSESLVRCLESIIDPIFEVSEGFRLVSWKFSAESFSGNGGLVIRIARNFRNALEVPYQPGLAMQLRRFITEPADDFCARNFRGAIVCFVDVERLENIGVLSKLRNPHFVRNLGAIFSPVSRRYINSVLANQDGRVVMALSDRNGFGSLHFFGNARELRRILSLVKQAW